MPTPDQLRHQVERLTSDLIGLSLCNHQNFPSVRNLGGGITVLDIGKRSCSSLVLKNVPYHEVYSELERTHTYNLRMIDGALVQLMYRFNNDDLVAHRLAFFPSPFLEEFQNNPEIYLEDELFAEVIMRNIVPFPLRFDFESSDEIHQEVQHPKTHLTLGQYKNCRIPVSAPLTPYHFVSFILRNFYNTAYEKYCEGISSFPDVFNETMVGPEKRIVHMQIPCGG